MFERVCPLIMWLFGDGSGYGDSSLREGLEIANLNFVVVMMMADNSSNIFI